MTTANAAIVFEPTAFDGAQKELKGRHVAGASFLDGFVRYADVERFVELPLRRDHAASFETKIADLQAALTPDRIRPAQGLAPGDLDGVAGVGTLFSPDPTLTQFAWSRRHVGQRAYSICGITHTISSAAVQQQLADYLTAPMQPWDALICTSTAVRAAAVRVQETFADYLEARIGARPPQPMQMPVIPLGTDVETYRARGEDAQARSTLRARLGVGDDDVLMLFFGRLAFHAKAHPVPMFLAMQRAQARLGHSKGRLHLLMTGQFANIHQETAFRSAVAGACPDVPVHFIYGSPGPEAWASWAAADVFLSLSDNIQESFGITPVEAMAARLPCVVSDWNGCKDTVADGVTGIRAASWFGQAPIGAGMARAYDSEAWTYDHFVGGTCLVTSVDVDQTAEALTRLAADPDLRRTLGDAGYERARSVFDWSAIIPQYQALWADLAERRGTAGEIAPPVRHAVNPALADPTATFQDFPTHRLSADALVGPCDGAPSLDWLFGEKSATFRSDLLLPRDRIQAMVDLVAAGPCAVSEVLQVFSGAEAPKAVRSVLWLAKFGVLSLRPAESGAASEAATDEQLAPDQAAS